MFLEPALDRGAMFPHRWQGSNGRFQQQSPSVSASLLWHRSVEMDLNYPALASASWKPASPWLSGSGTGKRWLLPLHFLSTAPPSAHYPSLQSESHPGLFFFFFFILDFYFSLWVSYSTHRLSLRIFPPGCCLNAASSSCPATGHPG